ncbi:MAG: protein phosphatase 2C domain-containing protein [Acidobacteriota bacterium]
MESNLKIESAAVTDRGLSEKRPQNEDSYLDLAARGIFAVADGVGGAQAGDVASQMAIEILAEAFDNKAESADAEEIMRLAIDRANMAIYQMASDLPQLSSMATTIVALHIAGDVATICHVGDSRLYRLDPEGRLHRETHDHSVVEEEVRAGRMTPEQALSHPSRNVISRALGAESTVDIDIKTIMVRPNETFLLCSDGITRHIHDEELGGILENGESPQQVCEALKAICFERGAEDNLTAVIVGLASAKAETYAAAGAAAGLGVADLEEVTIANARSPFDSPAATDHDLARELSVHFDSVDNDTPADEESFLMVDADEPVIDLPEITENDEYHSKSVIVPAAVNPSIRAASETGPGAIIYSRSDKRNSEGTLSRILSVASLLVLGAIFGVAGYYLWLVSNPPPEPVVEAPAITEMKSNNTALTAFEEGRRQVDSDPAKYIQANAASPQEAEDYFLLGRAFLLTGRYWEAKRSFNEAKNRLSQVDQNNSRTIAAEIALALAVIESPQATESFKNEITSANPVGAINSNASLPQR